MTPLARPEHLATTDWLAEHLGEPGIAILDARWRPDGSAATVYASGHLPGARHIDWRHDLVEPDDEGDVLLLAGPDRVAAVAARAGIGPDTTVVIYDDSQSLFAARTWWSLRAYGIESVRVLDGGFPAWAGEGRPISNAEPVAASVPPLTLPPANRLRVTTSDVRAMLSSTEFGLVDARAAAEYKGFEGNTRRLGHIPGALNLPAGAMGEPGSQRLRRPEELQERVRAADLHRGRRLVCYDGSGIAAAKLAWILMLLGHEDVAVYDGGWADWGNRLDLPAER